MDRVIIFLLIIGCNAGASQLVNPADISRYKVKCKETRLVGFGEKLRVEEMRAFNRAKFVCAFQYIHSPCLVQFEKYAERDYHATCGRGE